MGFLDLSTSMTLNDLESPKYTVFQKKPVKLVFLITLLSFHQLLIVFGTKMAKTMELWKVDLFSTSTNLCQRTTT